MNLRKASVLVLDDDPDILTAVRLLLKTEVREVVTEKRPEAIPSLLSSKAFDVVLLDMNYNSAVNTGNEGLYWLRRIKELRPHTAVVMITAYGDIDIAVRSLKSGADDFVLKPWQNERLLETIEEVLKNGKSEGGTRTANHPASDDLGMLGESEAMQDVLQKITKVAPTDANILILGENGTGKELAAQAIHRLSARAAKPFVKVDVGALTESLFESELFGHKKGAFTDARADRAGRFEAAHGGTLFLDEIGNISLPQQAKLLTVLQNRQVTPLGSNGAIPVDIRLVCATNIPLKELAREERFRKDLIYRINTVEITMPPLRARLGDIPLLAKHFAAQYAEKYARASVSFSDAALRKLKQYSFPGNVRELQYTIERAVIMSGQEVIGEDDLIFSQLESAMADTDEDLSITAVERNTILRVVSKHGGNITRAAKELGLTRATLYKKLGQYEA